MGKKGIDVNYQVIADTPLGPMTHWVERVNKN